MGGSAIYNEVNSMKKRYLLFLLFVMPLSSCISFSRMGAISIENEEGSYDSSV